LSYHGNVDSKFRYVIIAAKRARQLLKGAKPRIKSKFRNPILIAQEEVLNGQVEYEILPVAPEVAIERDEGVPVASVVSEEAEEPVESGEEKVEEEEEEQSGEEDGEEGGLNGILEEDKDD